MKATETYLAVLVSMRKMRMKVIPISSTTIHIFLCFSVVLASTVSISFERLFYLVLSF